MITFGDICGLAFLIGFATLIINWLIYERQQSKEKEMWDIIHNEIDNFVQFLASLKSANEISVGEIDWYVNRYCRIEREEITDNFMLEALDRRDQLIGKNFGHRWSGTTEKFNLMDKYKNTENFNEVEFFQELNEKLREFEPKERHRVELAINKGRYLKHANSSQYIDFNNVLKFEAITREDTYYAMTMENVIDTKIFFKHKKETSECDGVEIVELFNKWKMKQQKQLNK
jgi:hypothetical protein